MISSLIPPTGDLLFLRSDRWAISSSFVPLFFLRRAARGNILYAVLPARDLLSDVPPASDVVFIPPADDFRRPGHQR